uniref:Uncharacterized protein n=1 Tax=viral metagenome TaxID=1070528 RepID=A0A6H1ZRY4_9ZZZZ
MGAMETGNATPEKRKGRLTLSVRDPLIESLVVGLDIEGESLDRLRRFCKGLARERNRWDVARRAHQSSHRRISKGEADEALRRELRKVGAL